jgi:hypothetical protein
MAISLRFRGAFHALEGCLAAITSRWGIKAGLSLDFLRFFKVILIFSH